MKIVGQRDFAVAAVAVFFGTKVSYFEKSLAVGKPENAISLGSVGNGFGEYFSDDFRRCRSANIDIIIGNSKQGISNTAPDKISSITG